MAKEINVDKRKEDFVPLSGFQSENKYRRQKDEELAELEKELQEAQGQADEIEEEADQLETQEVSEDKESNKKGSENWKKRYGDLRSHFSKKEQEWNGRLQELEEKLEAQSNQVKYPTTDEEFEEWITKYPKVAAAMETMILKNSEGTSKKIKEVEKRIAEEKMQNAFDRAMNQLLALHPDFTEIAKSDQFQDWLADQPTVIQNTINNPGSFDDDAVKAASITVNMYKSAFGLDKKSKKSKSTTQDPKDAAKSVSRSNNETPETDDGKPIFSESQLNSMTSQQYEKLQDQILEAQREGRFEYDISGAAR